MSNSKAQILKAVAASKPALVALPEIDLNEVISYDDLVQQFRTVLESIGGSVVMLENISQLDEEIAAEKSAGNFVINLLDANAGEQAIPSTPAELSKLSKLYMNGGVPVAENGSIWVDDQLMKVRLLPFICEQLVIVVKKENIVATMHHAYARLGKIDTGFGVFIAGPSKTADIEQSLVIGAHGAKGLCVYIV